MNTLTHHMIDNETVSADEVMESFRKAFPLFCRCYVSEDGTSMIYRLRFEEGAQKWEDKAREIIRNLNLPMEADLEIWKRGGVVFEVNLSIEYKP